MTLFSMSLTLPSSLGAAFTGTTAWDPGESRVGLDYGSFSMFLLLEVRESVERGFLRNHRVRV